MTEKTKKPNVMGGLLQWAPGGRWGHNYVVEAGVFLVVVTVLSVVVAVLILKSVILPQLVNLAREVGISWPNLQLMPLRIPAAWGRAVLLAIAVGVFTLSVLWMTRSEDKRTSDPKQIQQRFHDWAMSEGLDIQERSGDQFRVRWHKRSGEGSVEEMEELQRFSYLAAWGSKGDLRYAVEVVRLVFRSIHPGVPRQETVPLFQVRIPLPGPIGYCILASSGRGFSLLGPEWVQRLALMGDMVAMEGPMILHPEAPAEGQYPAEIDTFPLLTEDGSGVGFNVGFSGIEGREVKAWLSAKLRDVLFDLGTAVENRLELAVGPYSVRVIVPLEASPIAWNKAIALGLALHGRVQSKGASS